MIINKLDIPLDIIILAGQSNAQGLGRGDCENPYTEDENILVLHSCNKPTYIKNDNGEDVFICPDSEYCIDIAREDTDEDGSKIGCLVLPFAREYAKEFLNAGRKVLIVKMGIGGTGFAHDQWGVGQCLLERMIEMTDEALAMNNDNRVVAMVWHQGECDAFERPELTSDERESIHYTNLSSNLRFIRERYGSIPFTAGGFANEWAEKFRSETDAVMNAIKAVCNDFDRAEFIPADDLESNNQAIGNGDDIHFSRSSLYTLADRYYKAYKRIVKAV